TWGVDDCTAAPAAWIRQETGLPIYPLRYVDRAGAMALIEKHGGLVNLWDRTLNPVGIFMTDADPAPGDVGVIEMRTIGDVGCIFAKNGIAMIRVEYPDGSGGWKWMTPRRKFCHVWGMTDETA